MSKMFSISNYAYRKNLFLFLYRKLSIKLLKEKSFPMFSLVPVMIRHFGLGGVDEFFECYNKTRKPFEEKWNSRKRINREDFESFYKEHTGGAWRQAWQSGFDKSYKYKICYTVDSIKKMGFGPRSEILDYGCGAGAISNALYNLGYRNLTVADIDSATLDFVKTALSDRFKEIVTIRNDEPLEKDYDIILVLDCLEHTFAPYRILCHLIGHLRQGGGACHLFSEGETEQDAHGRSPRGAGQVHGLSPGQP